MGRKGICGLGALAAILLLGCAGWAEAGNFVWDKNGESDVRGYEMYTCNISATCDPIVEGTRLGVEIPHPTTGATVTMPIPLTASGRAQVLAVDTVNNKSQGSNIIPFRGQPLTAPTGLQHTP